MSTTQKRRLDRLESSQTQQPTNEDRRGLDGFYSDLEYPQSAGAIQFARLYSQGESLEQNH